MALGVSRTPTARAIDVGKSLVAGCVTLALLECNTARTSNRPVAQPRAATEASATRSETPLAHPGNEQPAIASLGPDGLRAHDAGGRALFTIAPDTDGEIVCVPTQGIAVFSLGELRLFRAEPAGTPTFRRTLEVPANFCAWNGFPLCIVRHVWRSADDEDFCVSIADGSPDTMTDEQTFSISLDASDATTSRRNCSTGAVRADEPLVVEAAADGCVTKLANGVVQLPGVSAACDVRSLGASVDGRYAVIGSSAPSGDFQYFDLLLLDRRARTAARLGLRVEAFESVQWSGQRNDLLVGGRLYAGLPTLTARTLGARACFVETGSNSTR